MSCKFSGRDIFILFKSTSIFTSCEYVTAEEWIYVSNTLEILDSLG